MTLADLAEQSVNSSLKLRERVLDAPISETNIDRLAMDYITKAGFFQRISDERMHIPEVYLGIAKSYAQLSRLTLVRYLQYSGIDLSRLGTMLLDRAIFAYRRTEGEETPFSTKMDLRRLIEGTLNNEIIL